MFSLMPLTEAVGSVVPSRFLSPEPPAPQAPDPGYREEAIEWDGVQIVFGILDGRIVSAHVAGAVYDDLEGRR